MPPRKKGQQGDQLDADAARSLIHQLDQTGQLPQDVILKLLRCDQPPCPPSCKQPRKDNPCCMCGLVPARGSFRRKGLWQKEPAALMRLGPDPSQARRATSQTPAGLNNLGNTCYVNSALQLLAAIPGFRDALYALEPSIVAQQEIVAQLQELFLQLQFGPRASVDPTAFAAALQLDHGVQQDGQEFLKLLLAKLEGVFGGSSRRDVRESVQALFRGTFSYVTTCRVSGALGVARMWVCGCG